MKVKAKKMLFYRGRLVEKGESFSLHKGEKLGKNMHPLDKDGKPLPDEQVKKMMEGNATEEKAKAEPAKAQAKPQS